MNKLRRTQPADVTKALCLLLGAAIPAALVSSPLAFARATGWLLLETCVAVALSLALGLSARMSVVTKYRQSVEVLISRGLELVAALPIILSVAALTVVTPTPIPLAVALVIGSLSGLRHLSHAVATPQRDPRLATATAPIPRAAPAVVASIPIIIEQLVSLEAAVAWLGPIERTWSGGWGEHLGRYARQVDFTRLGAWALAAVGLSLTLGMLSRRFPVRHRPGAVATTTDTRS